jgi:hypothetical protein
VFPYRVAIAALLTGCSAGSALPARPSFARPASLGLAAARSKYIYVTDRRRNELIVYPAHQAHPRPIRALGARQGLVEVGGVAVDSAGNVYVANGSAANVLEFTSGGVSLVRTYREMLKHPVNVAVGPDRTLYVVDQQDNYSSGATSSVVEYGADQTQPRQILLDPSMTHFPLRGIAVDSRGGVFVSISPAHDVWPPPEDMCAARTTTELYDFILPTLVMEITLSANTQAWGIAFDGNVLYASDLCRNAVQTYGKGLWQRIGALRGTFAQPVYQTVSADHLLLVPSAGNGAHGYVSVVNLLDGERSMITARLRTPIGAAAGP